MSISTFCSATACPAVEKPRAMLAYSSRTSNVAAVRPVKLPSRSVQSQCIHCLKAGVLQPQFCPGSDGGRSAQLLTNKLLCSQNTSRGVVLAAEKRSVSNAGKVEPEVDAKGQPTDVADDQPGKQGTPEEYTSVGVKIALSALRFYKREISPILPPSCRFIPTCSEYAMDSFKQYGVKKGFILTAWRLLRCNPFGPSGYDPVKWPPPKLEWIFEKDG